MEINLIKKDGKITAAPEKSADTYGYEDKMASMLSAWSNTYKGMADDFLFASGGKGMWEKGAMDARTNSGRPMLSLPLIQPYIDATVAPIRMHPPGMSVRTEDPDVQKLVNGMLRAIEKASSATDKYSQSIKCASTGGLGWLYLSVDEINGENVLRIKTTNDPVRFMIDPASIATDGSDAMYAVYRGYVSKGEAAKYGEEATAYKPQTATGALAIPDGCVQDCIWWFVEEGGMRITRTIGAKEIYNQLFAGVKGLPVAPVIGEEIYSQDGRKYAGLVRRAKDINGAINITASNMMELIAMAPKAPWLIAQAAVKGHQADWSESNIENQAYLMFNHEDDNGKPLPIPTRLDNSPQTAALMTSASWFKDLFGSVMGINDIIFGGLQSAQESGRSLIARMEAATGASAHYVDHLTTSMAQLARIAIEMMPVVYTGMRNITLIDENGKSLRLDIDLSQVLTKQVIDMLDVDVESGPNAELKRKQAGEAIQQMMLGMGDKGIALLGMWADTQPVGDAQKIKDQIAKVMPPELQDGQQPGLEQIMMTVQQKDQELNDMHIALQNIEGQLAQAQAQINSQEQVVTMELRKAEIMAEVSIRKTQMEIDSKKEIEFIKQGSEDQRTAVKLSAEQEKMVAKTIADMMAMNQKAQLEAEKEMMEVEPNETASNLPKYVLDQLNPQPIEQPLA